MIARLIQIATNRQAESMAAAAMIGTAIALLISPESIAYSGFHFVGQIGLKTTPLILIFMVAASARIACLLANGHWPRTGPRCRVVCAFVGFAIWLQMGGSLVVWSIGQHITTDAPIEVVFIVIFTGSELLTIYRVARDGHSARH